MSDRKMSDLEVVDWTAWTGPMQGYSLNTAPPAVHFVSGGEPLVIFKPDGTMEFPKGETREAAKAFWEYVEQFMAESYRTHAAEAKDA